MEMMTSRPPTTRRASSTKRAPHSRLKCTCEYQHRHSQYQVKQGRRHFGFQKLAEVGLGVWITWAGVPPPEAQAAPDLPKALTSLFKGGKSRFPNAIKFPRRQVNDDLAVACMRSLYATVEDMKIVNGGMGNYQKDFWVYRGGIQPEYLDIIAPLKPRVGDLTDPLYLDFISYAQFYVAAQTLAQAIKVDKSFQVEDSIYTTFEEKLGDSILTRLGLLPGSGGEEEGGEGVREKGIEISDVSGDARTVTDKVQACLNFLVKDGYALKANAELRSESDNTFQMDITLVGTTTLWGTEAIQNDSSSRDILPLGTSFDAYATKSLLKSLGCKNIACKLTTVDSKNILQEWTISK